MTMKKILHIDTDLQLPNRIHKSDTDNKVRQITDKAQNIAFVQTDPAKQPVYNYGGYYSFDGVNDVVNYPKMFYDFSKPNYTLFLLVRPTNLAKKQTIMACRANDVTFFTLYQNNTTGMYSAVMRINGAGIYGAAGTVPLVENQWNTIVLTVADNQASIIINGKMSGSGYGLTHSGFSIPDLTVAPTQIGHEFDRAGWFFAGDIAYIKMEQKDYPEWQQRVPNLSALQFENGATVFDDTFLRNDGFTHYQRYPEDGFKKLFISSKYLKDAVIDSEDKVEKLNSSLFGQNSPIYENPRLESYFYQNVVGNKPTITKSGIKFISANNEHLMTANDDVNGLTAGNYFYHYVTNCQNDWCGMLWFMPQSTKLNQFFFELRNITGPSFMRIVWNYSENAGNKFLFYDDNTLTSIGTVFDLNKYVHVCFIKKSNVNYYFLNGILVGSSASIVGTTDAYMRVDLGTTNQNVAYSSDCLIDDIYMVHGNSVIDPTGFTVGQKVFEPPRRGDFDGIIKQY